MQFLSPLFLAAAAAIAIPIALHLFRRRLDTVVPFSAVRFLRQAPVEQSERRRLRDLLLLALRVTALALLALSFARPYFAASAAVPAAPLTIVAVDTSYSMATSGQVMRARELARAAVDDAPSGGEVAVVRFDVRADVAVAPTADRGLARAAVSETTPGAGGTRYGAALAAAADLAAGRPARLVVVTDLQQRGWAERSSVARPASLVVDVRDVGASAGNVSLASLERTRDGVSARVRNAWPERRTTSLVVGVDGREVARQPVAMAPGGEAVVIVKAGLPAAGVVRASLEDAGGYPADDERLLVLDAAPRPRIVIVAGEGPSAASSLYVRAALAAVERAEFDVVTWRPAQGGTPWDGGAAVLLLGTYGLERSTLEAIVRAVEARKGGLVVAAGPALEPARLASVLPDAFEKPAAAAVPTAAVSLSLAPTDVRHPAFRSFEGDAGWLAAVRVNRTLPAAEPAGARVLARFSDGAPALVEHAGPGRVLVLATDLSNAWSDFALHPAFVPFVHGLVRYAASEGAVPRDLLVGDRPDLVRPGAIVDHGARVAVNVDPAEADRSRVSVAAFVASMPPATGDGGAPRRTAAARQEAEQSLWRYGLMVMLAALVIESAVGRRT
jgi:hypothetical protein